MNDPVMTIREIAIALKLAEKTVYAMASEGDLPAFKIRGQWRVRKGDFELWLSQQAGAPQVASIEVLTPTPFTVDLDPLRSTEAPIPAPPAERAVEDLTERVPQDELHRRLIAALGSSSVISHSPWDAKPFEVDLSPPLPRRVRIYIYNATRPPGGRPLGEHKVQPMVPGQRRGQRASFDNGDGRIVLFIGYAAEEDVFILWDAGLYPDFAWSRNVQVKAATIIQASAGKLATQERRLRPPSGRPVVETVLAAKPRSLAQAIVRRMELTRERLLRD